MNPKIKKLTTQEARKIAAGEVVERPANIVKELVENSIDAGSTIISIWVEKSGKNLIRVVDNGHGMNEIDARLCFEHHATSKINTIEDLNTLLTFGFRGEALSSISSVSKIALQTNTGEQGFLVELEDGKIINEQNISCSTGTDISVKNLFYNIPARLKFLKQDETEWRQILNLFQAFCLSHKNIHFKLFHDDKLIYNCPPTDDLKNKLVQLWDHNFAQNMINISAHEIMPENKALFFGNLNISGVISNHSFFRYNRSQIFFFVNGRWVKNQILSKNLLKGYLNVLPKDRFPAAFIFITIDSEHIDVNIHPRKEEVQFLNPKKVEQLIQNSAKKSLEIHLSKQMNSINNNLDMMDKNLFGDIDPKENYKPAGQTTFDFEQLPFFNSVDTFVSDIHYPQSVELFNTESINSKVDFQNSKNKTESFSSSIGQIQEPEAPQHISDVAHNFDKKDYELIGQFDKTYILLEKPEGLFIIDQHAAHERVLYELFAKRFKDVATTRLIFPETINLNEDSINILIPHLEMLHVNGIDINRISKDQLVIQSTPVYLKDISLEDLIKQFISWIEEYQVFDKDILFRAVNEKLHAQMACKAAVKAGDKLSNEQIYKLLEDLNKSENRFACPHGRPTGWLLSTYEIEKKFKRKF